MTWDFARELDRWGPTTGRPPSLSEARAYCAHVTRTHYENFTVVSWLLPRQLVPHFHAVYAFCRWADDLADEAKSLPLLRWWGEELEACYAGTPKHPVTVALADTASRYRIPPAPFRALLAAFERDQRQTTYETFADLLSYCEQSANPVGHLVLYLFECFDAERAALADETCTGLQLANFWQDVARDHANGRVYLPAEDRRRFGYTDDDLAARRCTPAFVEMLRFQVERTRGYFDRGERLLPLLPKAARVDVALFNAGGRAVLDAIARVRYDVWATRPVVPKWRKVTLLLRAILT